MSMVVSSAAASAVNIGNKNSGGVLQGLKERFPNLSFTVGNKPTANVNSRGFNHVTLSPQLLRRMEREPEFAAEMEKKFERIPDATEFGKDLARKRGATLLGSGVMFDDDGGMSSWGVSTNVVGNGGGGNPFGGMTAPSGTREAKAESLLFLLNNNVVDNNNSTNQTPFWADNNSTRSWQV